jgi:hypothetical protein
LVLKKEFEIYKSCYIAPGEVLEYEGEDYMIVSILSIRSNWNGKCDVTAIVLKQ